MDEYVVRNALAKTNYELLCDYDIVLGLTRLVDIGGSVRRNNIFVCDFVASIKLNVGDLYDMYTTLVKRYDDPHF